MSTLDHRREWRSHRATPALSEEGCWPAPVRLLAILGAALSSWAVALLAAYQVVSLF